jgi:elongation factor 1-beta
VEPVAFGINAIYLWIAMPETIEGGTYDLENRLSAIEGISQVDIVSISRLIE